MNYDEAIKELQKIIDGNTCSWNQMAVMLHAIKLLSKHTTPTGEVVEAVEFAEWIGEQGLFNGLSPDNIRRWHKMVGNSKALTTVELYKLFQETKSI